MRNFSEINSDLDSHSDKIHRLEQAVVSLLAAGGYEHKALRLLAEIKDENYDNL